MLFLKSASADKNKRPICRLIRFAGQNAAARSPLALNGIPTFMEL
jgi:hypothetical protein